MSVHTGSITCWKQQIFYMDGTVKRVPKRSPFHHISIETWEADLAWAPWLYQQGDIHVVATEERESTAVTVGMISHSIADSVCGDSMAMTAVVGRALAPVACSKNNCSWCSERILHNADGVVRLVTVAGTVVAVVLYLLHWICTRIRNMLGGSKYTYM